MIDSALQLQLIQNFPVLRESLPPTLLERLWREGVILAAPHGARLFENSSPCEAFPLVISGAIRVIKSAANGRELQLYRVEPGDTCIMTTSCLLGDSDYPARGEADGNLLAIALPKTLFHRFLAEQEAFRALVFQVFAERMNTLMALVEEVAFRKLDQRLAALLLARGPEVHATHQQLADELGSVREIISRLLRSFQDRGWVSLAREQVQVQNPQALKELAEP